MSITAGIISSGSGAVRSRTTTITAAQLADLHNTPVELVPAPGVGKIIVPIAVSVVTGADAVPQVNFGGGDYVKVYLNPAQNPLSHTGGSDIQLAYEWTSSSMSAYSAVEEFGLGGNSGYEVADRENMPITAEVNAAIWVAGAIQNIVLNDQIPVGGVGYIALETVTIGDAQIRIDTVGGTGEVLTFTVIDPGITVAIGNNQSSSGGSGLNLSFDITAIDYSVNPMTLKVKVLYSVFDLS